MTELKASDHNTIRRRGLTLIASAVLIGGLGRLALAAWSVPSKY